MRERAQSIEHASVAAALPITARRRCFFKFRLWPTYSPERLCLRELAVGRFYDGALCCRHVPEVHKESVFSILYLRDVAARILHDYRAATKQRFMDSVSERFEV